MTRGFMGIDLLSALIARELCKQIAVSDHGKDVLRGSQPLRTEKQRRKVNTVNREPEPQAAPPSRQVRRQMERQAQKQGMGNE